MVLPKVTADYLELQSSVTRFDLEMHFWERPAGLHCYCCYATDLFEHATIERLVGHMRRLLEGIVAAPEKRIGELPLLTLAEERQLLVEWNATTTALHTTGPWERCLRRRRSGRSEAIAVSCRARR
ncbi:MAG: hypothetical protein H6951_19395 [Zoogloeaceae bacterium]|nr:hypothetical protein [Zoogloeaceae bacterium]